MRLETFACGAAAVLLALAGCTGEAPTDVQERPSPSLTGSTATVEVPERPRNGACHRLTVDEAASPTHEGDPVACSERHTARTLHVGELTPVVDGQPPAVNSSRARREQSRNCRARFADFVGGTPESRRLSRFQVVWYAPTLEQAGAGADWFRCDLVAFGAGDRLLPLPTRTRLRGVLDGPGGLATFGLCGTAQPGARNFERVACGLRHSWVAISTISIEGGERYPGTGAVRDAGEERCLDVVRSRNELVLQLDYGWEWPTRAQWRAGQRFGFCWAPNELA